MNAKLKEMEAYLADQNKVLMALIEEMKQWKEGRVAPAVGAPPAQGASPLDTVTRLIQSVSDIAKNFGITGGGTQSAFVKDIETLMQDNMKDTFKLVQLDLKDLLMRRGAPLTAAQHLELAGT
jgi:hypothetical protein